jgi:hypothetical protein
MKIQIDSATETWDKRDRSRLAFGPFETSYDCLVHIIPSDRGTNDRMDRSGQVL